MKKEFKTKWVNALRSGEYSQGRGYLKNNNGYCCLGVLCEVAGAEFEIDPSGMGVIEKQYWGALPDSVGAETGFNHNSHVFIDMNDNEGKSFNEIANYIEKNVSEE